MEWVFQIVPAGSSIIAATPYRVVKMDLKKIMALAMMALMVIPSMTMTVGAVEEDMASAIERAQTYLDKVRAAAVATAKQYEGDPTHVIHGYLNELLDLIGQDWEEDPEILFQTGGSGTAEWSSDEYHSESRSAELYVVDGVTDWAEVSIPVDIALKDISELKFWEYIESYAPNGWSVNVLLGVDADGDDDFEADVAAWHQGTTMHTLEVLHGDSFVQMDGADKNPNTGVWNEIDALSSAWWWTPHESGAGFASFYGSVTDFINVFLPDENQDSLIPDADARVKCVKLVIGGSGNWMDETVYIDDVTINGVTYDFEEEHEELGAQGFLDQALAYHYAGDNKSAARCLTSARNILGRIKGLLNSMAKAHKVARTERFNRKFTRRIEGIREKIERRKGPK